MKKVRLSDFQNSTGMKQTNISQPKTLPPPFLEKYEGFRERNLVSEGQKLGPRIPTEQSQNQKIIPKP